uniref:fimbrial protein n=1 Tax=Escherichia coli TaxID=562 RepID=UPI00228442E1
NGGKNSLNRLIRCVCGKKIGPDPRNFNQRVNLGRNDLLIRTFLSGTADGVQPTAFANQATTDAATNVALQMYLPDGSTSVTPGTETSNIQLADSAEQTVTFKVDYIATGKATSGNVNAVTNFHINYY